MPWGTGVSLTDPTVGRGPVPGDTMGHRGCPPHPTVGKVLVPRDAVGHRGCCPSHYAVGRGPVPRDAMGHRGLPDRPHCGKGSCAWEYYEAQGSLPQNPLRGGFCCPGMPWGTGSDPHRPHCVERSCACGCCGVQGSGNLLPHGNTSPTSTWSHWGSIPMDPQPEQGLPQGRVGLTLILELSAGSFGMRGEPWAALHCQPPTVPWSSTAEPPCC